jgi:integrase
MKDDEMYRHPRLHKRGDTFYFRAKVPVDLLPFYPGAEIKFSLRTRDRQTAWQRVQLESLRLDREFDTRRKSACEADAPLNVVTSIDDEFISKLKASFLRDSLDSDTDLRTGPFGEVDYELRQEQLEQQLAALKHANRTGDTSLIEGILKIFLRSQGYELRLSDRDYRRLSLAFLQGYTKTIQSIALRDEGELVEPEVLAPSSSLLPRPTTQQTVSQVTWGQLFDKWRLATARRAKTSDEFQRILKAFESFAKGLGPAEVSKRHVIEFRDHLLAQMQSSKTVDKKISILRTIFRVAVHDEILPIDPTAGVLVAMPKVVKKARTGFTTDELSTIFGAQLFQRGAVASRKFGPAEFWLPLIGLYTGARIEEIAQLRVNEIQHHPKLGHFFNITDEGEDSEVKNESSRRRVPIHQALLVAGLLTYAKSLPDQSGYLFPTLTTDKYRRRSSGYGKEFGKFLRDELKILDRRKVFHSFRHLFKHRCRELGISEDVHDALTGHTSASEARAYGNDQYPLEPLFAAMATFNFEGVPAPLSYGRWPK